MARNWRSRLVFVLSTVLAIAASSGGATQQPQPPVISSTQPSWSPSPTKHLVITDAREFQEAVSWRGNGGLDPTGFDPSILAKVF